MNILISWLLNAVAVFASAYILPGVTVESFVTALVVSIVLGIVNVLLKPLLVLLTLPITVLTLGMFMFVINALVILLVSNIVPGFTVDGFWWAVIYSIVLSIVGAILFSFDPK